MKLLPQTLFKSIRVRFGVIIAILLLLVFALSSGVLIIRTINSQNKTLITQARAFSELSSQPIGDTYSLYYGSGYLKFTELIGKILALNPDIIKVQIISANGEILFDSSQVSADKPPEIKNETDKAVIEKVKLNEESEIPARTEGQKPTQIIQPYFEDFGAHPFSIRYFISYDSVTQNMAAIITTSALLSAGVLFWAIILIFFVLGR